MLLDVGRSTDKPLLVSAVLDVIHSREQLGDSRSVAGEFGEFLSEANGRSRRSEAVSNDERAARSKRERISL
jgi:hypothetical protein